MSDVFVSYKAEDRKRVAPLVEALEADGLSVWWDARIGGGDVWRQAIEAELDRAGCVIVVWSKRSVGPEGSFVRDEAAQAVERGVYLPVTIAPVRPPLGFRERQAIALQGWRGDRSDPQYQAVLGAVCERIGRTSGSASPATAKGGVDRRLVLAGGAAVVAAIGVGAWTLFKPSGANADSIAVLPFANLSGDPTQGYFSDGIAEELRNALSRIPGLSVIARTSSESVRDVDAKTAARKLHVANILTGSVRRSPEMLRISAQLIDGSNGTERWSEVYDRRSGDSLEIQTAIANMVAQALSIHLGAVEQRALKEGGTDNPEAQDLLLQARSIAWQNDDANSLNRAMELVDRALALDPNYADALAGKAAILGYLGGYLAESAADTFAKSGTAEQTARRAIDVAPRSAQAHAALADILWMRLRLRAGLAEFAAMERLPGSASNYFSGPDQCAVALWQCGRVGPAVGRADRLIAADPLNPNAYMTKAMIIGHSGRLAEAEQLILEAVRLGPDLTWPRAFHAFTLMRMNRFDEADREFAGLSGIGPWTAWAAVSAERQGKRAEANRILSQMREAMGDSAHFQYAEVYAQQGRADEAIAELENAWRKRDPGLTFLQVDQMLSPLRGDPRFQAIVRRLDFPT